MVYSTSMYPTLIEKDLLILKRTDDIDRGDIVSFVSDLTINESDMRTLNIIQKVKANVGDNKNLIKRVVGVPGDSFMIKSGQVYINGELYKEGYVTTTTSGDIQMDQIPEGKYFLMGDNRNVSLDSRSSLVGLIDQEKIIGDVLIRIFPLNRMGNVK
jgi:signal peptidase I